MKQIKFRGKSKYSGKIIYGDFSYYKDGVYIDDEAVYEDSVAQLVGYDTNGKEVYEDDKLENIHNPDFTTTAYFDVFPEQDSVVRPDTFTEWKLKETQDETN